MRAAAFWLLPAVLLGAAGVVVLPDYTLTAGSRFRIEGTSSVGTWTCAASDLAGQATRPPRGPLAAQVTVRVRSFDCGVERMNRDFRDALRGDQHPEIRFVLDRAVVLDAGARAGAWVPVRATGHLRLAGAERPVTIAAQGRQESNGRVRLRGQHAMNMTDFGVTPPTGLGGVVRARDRITVVFDLRAAGPAGR